MTWFAPSAATAAQFAAALRAEGLPSAQMYGGLPVYAAPAILGKRTASMKGGPWNCAEHPVDGRVPHGDVPGQRGPGRPRVHCRNRTVVVDRRLCRCR